MLLRWLVESIWSRVMIAVLAVVTLSQMGYAQWGTGVCYPNSYRSVAPMFMTYPQKVAPQRTTFKVELKAHDANGNEIDMEKYRVHDNGMPVASVPVLPVASQSLPVAQVGERFPVANRVTRFPFRLGARIALAPFRFFGRFCR